MRPIASILVMFLFVQSASATTWYVDDDAAPGGGGLSWAAAFDNLNSALDAAAANDEILVAGGRYTPDVGPGRVAGDRTETFDVAVSLTIRGGYAGVGAGNPDARDIELWETVLSGDLLANDGPDFANYGDNSRNVMSMTIASSVCVLDGLTIRAGNNDQIGNSPIGRGGGLLVIGAAPTAYRCTFIANSAAVGGGAVFAGSFDARFERCRFLNNRVTDSTSPFGEGGGAICRDVSNLRLFNCLFAGNSSNAYGGAISLFYPSTQIINCVITDNYAAVGGGGIYASGPEQPEIRDTVLWGNRIGNQQGGVAAQFASPLALVFASILEGMATEPLPGSWFVADSFDADPRFANPAAGDYHVLPGSPCIDAGGETSPGWPVVAYVDLDGEPRIAGCSIDIGIDETAGGLPGSGDMNGDGGVRGDDIQLFVSILLIGSDCHAADLNGDGDSDVGDIPLMVVALLGL